MAEKRRLGKGSNDTVGYQPKREVLKAEPDPTPEQLPESDTDDRGKVISIRFDTDLLRYYKTLADRNRSNVSVEVRRTLADYMRRNPL